MRAERGMTLLEVMAAVAILGLVYTLLARAATQGVMSEGESRRRIEAALLADERMEEIQTQLVLGETPEAGAEEVDDFQVAVEVEPFLPPAALLELAAPPPEANAQNVLGDASGRQPSLLSVVRISVAWSEGLVERQVERVTLVRDVEGMAALAEPKPEPAP